MARTTRRSRRRAKALEVTAQALAAETQKRAAGKSRRKRRVPLWMGVLAGLAAGYGIYKTTGGGSQPALNDEFVAAAERLAAPPPPPEPSAAPEPDLAEAEHHTEDLDAPDDMEEPMPVLTGRPLADQVRSHLSADPRTADLPGLAINVAEGTVFVRGSVPVGYQESAIREVISSVPGVNDVDLQVSTST